jgi:F-type H+-transporting ATPase subunit epsilon
MAKPFRLQVFTQEKLVLDEQVTSVVIPGEDGYFGVMADHAPLIAALGKGKLTIISGSNERILHISGGFAEVANNAATILTDSVAA